MVEREFTVRHVFVGFVERKESGTAALKQGNEIMETETEYGIRERRFQVIDLKKKC